MKIRLKTRYAGPRGCFEPDSVLDLPPAEARALVEGGYAVECGAARPPPAQTAGPEAGAENRPEGEGKDAGPAAKPSADKPERRR